MLYICANMYLYTCAKEHRKVVQDYCIHTIQPLGAALKGTAIAIAHEYTIKEMKEALYSCKAMSRHKTTKKGRMYASPHMPCEFLDYKLLYAVQVLLITRSCVVL